jgi:hypothetical protein
MPPVSEQAFEAMKTRLNTLELDNAVRAESSKSVEARLSKIEEALSRVTWLLVSGIIMALIAFVVSGGLSKVSL